jgi:SAM-dependent methyltransferase
MLKKIANNGDEQSLSVRFRRKRYAFLQSLLSRLEKPVHILDIGGTEAYWKTMNVDDDQIFVTLLNLTHTNVTLPHMKSIIGDARNIPVPNSNFDVVFSNSVIEHVGGDQDQLQMAREVRRVGKRLRNNGFGDDYYNKSLGRERSSFIPDWCRELA